MSALFVTPRRRELAALTLLSLWVGWAAWHLRRAFQPGYLLGWDSLGHVAKVNYWVSQLWPEGRWDGWFPYWHGGFQLFQFYPPGFYWATGLLSLQLGLEQATKLMTLTPYLLLPFSLYGACRWLGIGRAGALVAGMLGLCLDSGYGCGPSALFLTGLLPNVWGVCLIPLVIAAWHWTLRAPSRRRSLITALLTALLLLTHTFSAYFAATAAAVFMAFRIAGRDWRALGYGLATGIVAILLSATWLVPALVKYPWHGLIGEWLPGSPAGLALDLIQGRLFGTAVGAVLGLGGLVVGWRRGGWQRELAVLALFTSILALGLINRYLPFGQVVGSTQFVRFHSYAGITIVLLAGILTQSLWDRRDRLLRWQAAEWPLSLLVILLALDQGHLHQRLNDYVRLTGDVPEQGAITAMIRDVSRLVPPEGRLLGQFDWNAGYGYGTPHVTSQILALWAGRADLAGNFPEGSRMANPTLQMNQTFEPLPFDYASRLQRFGVSHVLTITPPAHEALSRDSQFRLLASRNDMHLWALNAPGHLLTPPAGSMTRTVTMSHERFAFDLENPAGGPATLTVNAYPNWAATWNGAALPWTATDDHRMRVTLPPGNGRLVWAFQWQPWENACDWLSAATWIACFILLGRSVLVDRNRLPLQASAR